MDKALFLDRDGVINIEKNYLHKIEDFEFIEGIFELCEYFRDAGYKIFIVTNQSGIARKYYTQSQFDILSTWLVNEFSKKNIDIKHIYFCPHHPDISGECSCRKPKPGMLLSAQSEFNINLKESILIGDKERDIEAGLNAGLLESYLFNDSKDITSSKATKIVSRLYDIWGE